MQQNSLGRRDFLVRASSAALPLLIGSANPRAHAKEAIPSAAGLIVRQEVPLNLESPFASLDGVITPTAKFFVRNHFAVPALAAQDWQLQVLGNVERELKVSLADLKRLPATTLTATMECAGNGRAFLDPATKGVQWETGAVGNAEWTGVPLARVLEKAGVKDSTVEVVLVGADRGEIAADPKPAGPIHFARSLPLKKALQSEVLLAFQMNAEELSPQHGYPVRAVVPGWYGMASVKWLTKIIVAATPFQGYWQTFDYSYFQANSGEPVMKPITEMQVKATIARPTSQEKISAGSKYRIAGAAWAGSSQIANVEVSTSAGKQWESAKLLGQAVPFSWRLWEFSWNVPKQKGKHEILVRATDENGNSQPLERDANRRNYLINHVIPRVVEIT